MNRKFISHGLLSVAFFLLTFTALAQDDDEFEPVDLPDNIAEKVAGFDQEKIDFLSEIPESADDGTRAR